MKRHTIRRTPRDTEIIQCSLFTIHYIRKKTSVSLTEVFGLCWRLPIFPGRFQPSIVSASELNFRVRDGNGCTLTAIDTNYSVVSPAFHG